MGDKKRLEVGILFDLQRILFQYAEEHGLVRIPAASDSYDGNTFRRATDAWPCPNGTSGEMYEAQHVDSLGLGPYDSAFFLGTSLSTTLRVDKPDFGTLNLVVGPLDERLIELFPDPTQRSIKDVLAEVRKDLPAAKVYVCTYGTYLSLG
jgi:hypothetical protein